MSTWLFIGLCYRAIIVVLSFIAMWALWRSKELRGDTWTGKMRDIWSCLMLFTLCVSIGNLELIYRQIMPTFTLLIIGYTLIRTIRGCLKEESYTKDKI